MNLTNTQLDMLRLLSGRPLGTRELQRMLGEKPSGTCRVCYQTVINNRRRLEGLGFVKTENKTQGKKALIAITDKGRLCLVEIDRKEKLKKQIARLRQKCDRGEISVYDVCATAKAMYQRLGVEAPTRQQKLEDQLEVFGEFVKMLKPNMLMVIETGDEKDPKIATMTHFSKAAFEVKKAGIVLPTYSIEPVAGLDVSDIQTQHAVLEPYYVLKLRYGVVKTDSTDKEDYSIESDSIRSLFVSLQVEDRGTQRD